MLDKKNFERTINGKQTGTWILKNGNGMEITISNYGARIISLVFQGINVTPSYPSLDAYTSAVAPYHGATIGRYANRIAKGMFSLDEQQYALAINNAPNHLHGGPNGFHNQVWEVENSYQNSIVLSYFSADGEEGYPGDLNVSVSYSLSETNELTIAYTARTTKATSFNITNHAFFNLNGSGSILNHQLEINASRFTAVDASLIPTGEWRNVEESAFDFTQPKRIGEQIDAAEEQIKIGGGYDHNFILDKEEGVLSFAAKATGDKTGIVMEVFTEEPGIQLFSGNFEAVKGDASTYRNTFCLETQHFPDSPNQPRFPNTILKSGEKFESKTVYAFKMADDR